MPTFSLLAGLLLIGSSVVFAQDSPDGVAPQRISPEVAASNLLTRIDPIYPAISRAARVQATVTMDATIDKEGKVASLKVVKGHPLMDNAALEAVKQWRYRPFLLNGRPADALTSIEINFSLVSPPSTPDRGEIRGRIRQVDGGPAALMPVAAVLLSDTGSRLTTFVARTLTDASGDYRLSSIPAGRYHIEAGGNGVTYFPGTTTLSEAAAVAKASGIASVIGIDFTMSGPVRVSGRIAGEISAAALSALRVGLSATGQMSISDGPMSGRRTNVPIAAGPDGRFEFTDVLPGTYLLSLRTESLFASVMGGAQMIEVGGVDSHDNVLRSPGAFSVQVKAGTNLAGPVVLRVAALDQAGRISDVGGIQIASALLGATSDSGRANSSLSTQPDGSAALPLTEGMWLVYFPELQLRGHVVDSIAYGGADLLKEPLIFEGTARSGEIRVTLGPR